MLQSVREDGIKSKAKVNKEEICIGPLKCQMGHVSTESNSNNVPSSCLSKLVHIKGVHII